MIVEDLKEIVENHNYASLYDICNTVTSLLEIKSESYFDDLLFFTFEVLTKQLNDKSTL